MTRRPLLGVLSLLVAALAAACGEGGGDAGGSASDGPGFLVFSRPDGIYELSLEDNALTPLILPQQPSEYILDPAVSPDGTRIAYVVQPPARSPTGEYDAGSDLWIADRDGSGARMLYKHEQTNALVRFPRWVDDGRVAAIVQELTTGEAGVTSVAYTVQAFDVETGERQRVLDDALAFAFSPDGEQVTYARLVQGQGEVLEQAPVDGGATTTLVEPASMINPFASPRYSPDGERIAFAAADQTSAPPTPTGRLVSAAPMPAPALDGLPQDIWTVDASGGGPRLVAELKEDLPTLDWNGDGTRIYVLGALGLYEVNVENGAVRMIGEGVFHGVVDWTHTRAAG